MNTLPEAGFAFPVSTIDGFTQHGLTKREAAAIAAMQGLLANSYSDGMQQPLSTATRHDIAEMAVSQADALLAELARTAS